MRKTIISCLLLCCSLFTAQAEKVTLKTGTLVEMEAAQTVYARDSQEGDLVKFRVITDVKVDDKIVVPIGTMVEARITEAKKSTIAGTKGRLSINITNLVMADGVKIPLSGNCHVCGKNRTPLAVITGLLVWPCIFIPGTKAVLTEGYHATATVFSNTEVEIK